MASQTCGSSSRTPTPSPASEPCCGPDSLRRATASVAGTSSAKREPRPTTESQPQRMTEQARQPPHDREAEAEPAGRLASGTRSTWKNSSKMRR